MARNHTYIGKMYAEDELERQICVQPFVEDKKEQQRLGDKERENSRWLRQQGFF